VSTRVPTHRAEVVASTRLVLTALLHAFREPLARGKRSQQSWSSWTYSKRAAASASWS